MKDYFKNLFTYHWSIGMVAWMLMRISGIVLIIFLALHLIVFFYFGQSEIMFSNFLSWREKSFVRYLEPLLIFTLCYHALNGIRLIFLDIKPDIKKQNYIFWTILAISLVLTVIFYL